MAAPFPGAITRQAGKEAIDRIGGSGVFARDPDVVLSMTQHEEKDRFVIDLVLRALPQIAPFVVRWAGAIFERDENADPERLREVGKPAKKSKATYRTGSMAERYGALLEKMPPLPHHRDPALSQVVAFIAEAVAASEGECSIEEAARIHHALACMHNRGTDSPIKFDKTTRRWKGRDYSC